MKIVSVCSARPNFVKLAAVHHAMAARGGFEHLIVHTGQHYGPLLSDIFFKQLKIPAPARNLGIHGGKREDVIVRTQEAMRPVLREERPDIVLVYGDVNGAVGAAETAAQEGISLGHVEAGLRSGDLAMPEEHNRIAIDRHANLLFCTERSGMEHLEREGVKGERHLVGNTMIDTFLRMMPQVQRTALPFPFAGGHFAVATLHRPSNVDALPQLERVLHFLNQVGSYTPIVLPLHPRTWRMVQESGKVLFGGNVFVIEPLGYLEFIRQMLSAVFILTDSGGIQEEAVLLRKRCFTLRRNTERPVTIECGSNVLRDLEKPEDRAQVLEYASNPVPPVVTIPPLWDGKAGERICEILQA